MRLLALALVVVALSSPGAGAAEGEETCLSKPATVVGSRGVIRGTPGDDIILATGPEVVIKAGKGNDAICLVSGLVYGGDGRDSISLTGTEGYKRLRVVGVERYNVDMGSGGADVSLDLRSSRGRIFGAVVASGGVDARSSIRVNGSASVDLDLEDASLRLADDQHLIVRGFQDAFARAHTVRLEGDEQVNYLGAEGCLVDIRGGRGGDSLTITERRRTCARESQVLRGQKDDDYLEGASGDDVLLGGPGRDRAVGAGGRDRCVAESTSGCER